MCYDDLRKDDAVSVLCVRMNSPRQFLSTVCFVKNVVSQGFQISQVRARRKF